MLPDAPFITEPAYAKINLALHLLSRRSDGYHLLDSVVSFVDTGDMLRAAPTQDGTFTLEIDGAFGEGLATADNLVLRAAQRLQQYAGVPFGARLHLDKQIPIGAGLGGGSADAAAALRLLNRLWNLRYSLPALAELSEPLGADVPACVFSTPLRMEGIGERITPLPHVPPLAVLLMYPRQPLWTPDVYKAMQVQDFSGQLPPVPPIGAAVEAWLDWLHHSRNDLETAAYRLNPEVQAAVGVLAQLPDCLFARMSGSGSACFALFATAEQAEKAAAEMQRTHPQWWVRAAYMLSLSAAAVS